MTLRDQIMAGDWDDDYDTALLAMVESALSSLVAIRALVLGRKNAIAREPVPDPLPEPVSSTDPDLCSHPSVFMVETMGASVGICNDCGTNL